VAPSTRPCLASPWPPPSLMWLDACRPPPKCCGAAWTQPPPPPPPPPQGPPRCGWVGHRPHTANLLTPSPDLLVLASQSLQPGRLGRATSDVSAGAAAVGDGSALALALEARFAFAWVAKAGIPGTASSSIELLFGESWIPAQHSRDPDARTHRSMLARSRGLVLI